MVVMVTVAYKAINNYGLSSQIHSSHVSFHSAQYTQLIVIHNSVPSMKDYKYVAAATTITVNIQDKTAIPPPYTTEVRKETDFLKINTSPIML